MGSRHTRVSTETVFELVEPDGTAPVDVGLTYDTRDPYSVAMELEIRTSHRPSVWVVSRGMLAEGLLVPTGLGNVQITPATPEFVLLQLGADDEQASLWMSLPEIEEFLESTYDVVPIGEEDQWWEVDDMVRRLLEAA
ncbi:SsgA family sporulation/cell division regulator [Streptomyces sp. NPDC059002]|uniref:SsgA family sporulation/cell division regulator n=1 Tax=Streptomyces sp. NPDC059002 TaxID=3346690 RepID=UPI0036A2D4C9